MSPAERVLLAAGLLWGVVLPLSVVMLLLLLSVRRHNGQ